MTDGTPELAHIDEHTVVIDRRREHVWAALNRYVSQHMVARDSARLGRILGVDPPAGFERISAEEGREIILTGRHRFSRYQLSFEVADATDGRTRLTAITHASFPGVSGKLHRLAVVGSHGHAIVVKRMLRSIERRTR